MATYSLKKEIRLYKNQFDKFISEMYTINVIDRLSLDIDAILFKLRYIIENDIQDSDEEILKDEFIDKSIEMRNLFGEFMNSLIDHMTKYTDYTNSFVTDILANDVKLDNIYVTFTMELISTSSYFLESIDSVVDDNDVYNLYPNEFFRYHVDSYNDGIAKAYPELFETKRQEVVGVGDDAEVFCHTFTFQTTEDCSLSCTYCYQFNKSPDRMSFETAKLFVDKLLSDEYGYINRYNSPAIILEFIGGEPLLEIRNTRKIYEYFLQQTYEMKHPWFTMHRVSICSNGLQYFDDEVQDFFRKYAHNVSFNISIDGNKELHDSCRIQPNGEGSYDIAMAALNHYTSHYTPERNSKMTLAPSNVSHLFESVKDFIKNGMMTINLNCVFEEGWNAKTALIEYNQLKLLADYILENDLENLYIAIFRETAEDVNPISNDSNFCGGGSGSMLSLGCKGDFYPCIRYMPSSVISDVDDLHLGNVYSGMIGREEDSKVLEMMDQITRRSQTTDICFNCPIGNSCAACSALGHTIYGTPDRKTHFHCIQMIAESLANVYYWNLLNIKHPEYGLGHRKNNVPDEWSLLVINEEELKLLRLLEIRSILSIPKR